MRAPRVSGDPRDVGSQLPEYIAQIGAGWIATGDTTPHGEAMMRRWQVGSAGSAIGDEQWVEASYRSLRQWHAFRTRYRGAVTLDSSRAALSLLRPLLPRLEHVSISADSAQGVQWNPNDHARILMDLFGVAGDIKPGGSKWMVASKVLYHLLPDLVVPMDSGYTAPFFGHANLRFPLSDEFLVRAYSAFEVVAKSASTPLKSLADRYEPRLGLARVIDFGIVGYVYQQSSLPGNP